MSDYKRLTKRDADGNLWTKCKECAIYDKCDFSYDVCCEELTDRLAELEDMIEQGTLVQLDENLMGEEVIGIHKCTDGTYYLDLDENIVIGFTSNGIVTWNNSHGFNDCFENGYYFPNTEKGKAEAEAKLEELKRGKNNV